MPPRSGLNIPIVFNGLCKRGGAFAFHDFLHEAGGGVPVRFKVRINKKDALATGLLCLFGLLAALQVSAGSIARIAGAGGVVVSVVLCAALMLVGVLWLFDSRLSPDDDEGVDIGVSKWRGICGVTSGVFAFLLLVKYAGLIPAVLVSAFIFVLGDRHHTWRSAAVLAIMATCVAGMAATLVPNVSPVLFVWRSAAVG